MAKHVTRKSTTNGKHITQARKAARLAKRGPALDIDRLKRDLAR